VEEHSMMLLIKSMLEYAGKYFFKKEKNLIHKLKE
jgi:hypothetical protein